CCLQGSESYPVGSENSNTIIRGHLLSMRRHAIMADHMRTVLDPFRFLLVTVSGWMNQRQLQVIDYLHKENRVLREQLGERRLRFTPDKPPATGRQADGTGQETVTGDGHDRDSCNSAGMASETDRPKVRRQRLTPVRSTTNARRNRNISQWSRWLGKTAIG